MAWSAASVTVGPPASIEEMDAAVEAAAREMWAEFERQGGVRCERRRIASVMTRVSTLTRVTRRSRSMTFSLWSAKQ